MGIEFLDDGVAGRKPPPPDILVDSDVVIKAMQGEPASLSFLHRYGGRVGITGRSVGEAMGKGRFSRSEVKNFTKSLGVRFVGSRGASGRSAALRVGRPGDTHKSDMILLGTAGDRRMKFVTFGDGSAASAGIRLGVPTRIISPGERAWNKIMNAIPGKRLDPERYRLSTTDPL